jgi:hypothetical protein
MKGFFKFLFVLIFLAICALGIFFVIDYSRASEGQAPLFCIREDSVNDGGTVIYKGVFYKVIDYHKTINYSKNIFYDDVKIGTYGLKYEDYESEWNKLIEENKENEYNPVSTDQQSSIKDIVSGVTIDMKENVIDIENIINKITFRTDAIVDGEFQYELFISSKNATYEFGYTQDGENNITGGLIRNRADLSYAEIDAGMTTEIVNLIQMNLK